MWEENIKMKQNNRTTFELSKTVRLRKYFKLL